MTRTTNADIMRMLDDRLSSLTEAISAMVSMQAPQPVAQPVTQPAPQPVAQPVTQPVTQPVPRKRAKLHEAYRTTVPTSGAFPTLKSVYESFPDTTPVYGDTGCLHVCYPSPDARKAYIENGDASGLIIRQCSRHVPGGSHECTSHGKGPGTFAERAKGRHEHAERMYKNMIHDRGMIMASASTVDNVMALPAPSAISDLLSGITGK